MKMTQYIDMCQIVAYDILLRQTLKYNLIIGVDYTAFLGTMFVHWISNKFGFSMPAVHVLFFHNMGTLLKRK